MITAMELTDSMIIATPALLGLAVTGAVLTEIVDVDTTATGLLQLHLCRDQILG